VRGSQDTGGCFPTGRHYPGIAHLVRVAAAGLADEWSADTQMAELPLVSIDTETTGLDPLRDRIVELGCVVWSEGRVVRTKSWLVNPGCTISQEAIDVHGITDDEVRDKPSFGEIAHEVLEALAGAVPAAYNADFDRDFLNTELSRVEPSVELLPPAARRSVQWIDPLIWARELYKDEKGRSLGEVCARLGIEIQRAHRATDDAEAAVRALALFFQDVRVPRTYAAFMQEQRRLGRLFAEERGLWRSRPTG